MEKRIEPTRDADGIDRRGFLKCMAWVGTGLVWTVGAGIPGCARLEESADASEKGDFSFVQISDSHIGFSKEPNKHVTATLAAAIDKLNALKNQPSFLLHTGDLTHLSRPQEFDTVAEVLKGFKGGPAFFVPGEHDLFSDDGKRYRERYGKGTQGSGWHSFDHQGVHFVGLVNVMDLTAAKLGVLGQEQLDWLKKDVASLGDSTPLVVFAHVPLWTVYEKWGWGTQDSEQALGLLKRFGSVTVLNGHVHQILQKVEGKVTFHTARSTAFPQPEPGKAESPGPIKNVAADKLKSFLGVTQVNYVAKAKSLATVDSALE
jgi:3',5'-cyclic AMP phosphodiesterase CpdA